MGDLVLYIDVDDTLVRSFGTKRIPMTEMLRHVRELHRDGAVLYAWSSGGADYARRSAEELGVADCFVGFLPKPHVIVDDRPPADSRRLLHVHRMRPYRRRARTTTAIWRVSAHRGRANLVGSLASD